MNDNQISLNLENFFYFFLFLISLRPWRFGKITATDVESVTKSKFRRLQNSKIPAFQYSLRCMRGARGGSKNITLLIHLSIIH